MKIGQIIDLPVLIKDPIYGYVKLSIVEKTIIETSVFQRLRFITQNGLSFYTYPAIRGSRFEHSIGACHLCGRVMVSIFENSQEKILKTFLKEFCLELKSIILLDNFKNILNSCSIAEESELENLNETQIIGLAKFMMQLIRLLALIHDIGHPPFSHLGEEAIGPYKKDILNEQEFKEFERFGIKLHEFMGYKIVLEEDGQIAVALNGENNIYFYALQALLKDKMKKNKGNVLNILYELVDSDIDVDRGDYLRRDGYNSGIGFGRYDADRLIESIRVDLVGPIKGNQTYMIAPTDASISPVEDFLLERYKLYKWLYFHHSIKFFNTRLVKAVESIISLKK